MVERIARAAIVFAAVLLVELPAYALSCAERPALPKDGTAAPRNTRVWSEAVARTVSYRWRDADGQDVAFSTQRIAVGSSFVDVLTADELLAYPGSYRIEQCSEEPFPSCRALTAFTTTAEIDTAPPPRPDALRTGTFAKEDETWGVRRLVQFKLDESAIGVADVEGAAGDSPFAAASRLSQLSDGPFVSIGEGPCHDEDFAGESALVRFGSLDLAGNFSGFSEPTRVHKPDLGDGCSLARSGARSGPLDMLLPLLALLALRRRRHSASMP